MVFTLKGVCLVDSVGGGKGVTCVARYKGVVNTLIGAHKTRKTVFLTDASKIAIAAGYKLMSIALMPDIKNDRIVGSVQHAVNSDGKLNRSKIRGKVTAVFGNGIYEQVTNLGTKRVKLAYIKFFKVVGGFYTF